MPCYHPISGWRSRTLNESGKRSIVFNPLEGYLDMPLEVGCGSCVGCKMEYARQWAVRCVHEASLHDRNSFITLTYNSECIPDSGSVGVEETQLFFKRLRKSILPVRIRYFACGEYGDDSRRPHYHSIIFGYDFPDKVACGYNKQGHILYTSPALAEVWPYGFNWIGNVEFESCAYVARYTLKKQRGIDSYDTVDATDGVIYSQKKEFIVMSRGTGREKDKGTPFFGGIGSGWFEKFGKSDTFKDYITLNGSKMGLPKFYDMLLDRDDPDELFRRKSVRKYKAVLNKEDNTPYRLFVKEEIAKSKVRNVLKRDLE